MKENPNGLDERQREKRNRIGNQCFMLLLYALLLNIALYGAGIKWFPYPADVMVIVTVVAFIYLARIIASNAYLPPSTYRARGRMKRGVGDWRNEQCERQRGAVMIEPAEGRISFFKRSFSR